MAIGTSAYTPNDYQSVSNFRPYQLPVNDIVKAISAQNKFWEEGAARVKNVYENALGLKLSLEPNKEIRDSFMKEAEKQITKLSSMNVADPEVQRKGADIFTPLFKDEGMIYDDAMTRHYEKVRSDAMRFRNEKDSKGYHDNNFRYAMDGYEEFTNSTDRMAGKQFYQKRKEYTPYYDPTSEISTILKNCGHGKLEQQSPVYDNGQLTGYMSSTLDESLSSQKVNGCLSTMLSPKAQRQMEIDGYVTYKNNPHALVDKYIRFAVTSLGTLQQEFDSTIMGKLAGLEARIKKGEKLPPNELADYQMYKSVASNYKGQIDNYKSQLQAIAEADDSFIKDNFEKLAGTIHMNDVVKGWSDSTSYDRISKKLIADPVQLTSIRYNQELNLQNDRQNFERDEKVKERQFTRDENILDRQNEINKVLLEASLKGISGGKLKQDANGNYVIDLNATEGYYEKDLNKDDISKYGVNEFDNEFNQISKDVNQLNTLILSELNKHPDVQVTLDDGSTQSVKDYLTKHGTEVADLTKNNFIVNYLKTKGADPTIANYVNAKNELENKQRIYLHRKNQVEEELKTEFPQLVNLQNKIKDIKPISISGNQVTASDMLSAIQGLNPNLRIEWVDISGSASGGSGVASTSIPKQAKFYLNNKEVTGNDAITLTNLQRNVTIKTDLKGLQEKREEKYREANFELRGYKQITEPDKGLQTILDRNLSQEELKTKNLSQVAFDGTGKVIVSAVGMNEEEAIQHINKTGLGKNVAAKPLGNNKYLIETESYFKVNGAPSSDNDSLIRLLGNISLNRKLLNPKTPVGTEVDVIPQYFMGSKGLVNIEIAINKGLRDVPTYDVWIMKDSKRFQRVNVNGPIGDRNTVLSLIELAKQKN